MGADVDALNVPTWINTGMRVMPLGDSITEGWPATTGGYRRELYRLAIENDFPIDFCGSLSLNSDGLPDPYHDGHGGWTTAELLAGRSEDPDAGNALLWISEYRPEVVLLIAGTNDLFYGSGPEMIASGVLTLVDRIVAENPMIRIGVGTVPPIRYSYPEYNTIILDANQLIREGMAVRSEVNPLLFMVDINALLTLDDIRNDMIHISDSGNRRIGAAWFSLLQSMP